MNVEGYSIDNARTICETVPFYVRGRRLLLFLQSVAHPLKSVHEQFKKWALERNIEASITSQILPMQWYLTYKFKDRFINAGDSFRIIDNTPLRAWIGERDEFLAGEVGKVLANLDEGEIPEGFDQLHITNLTENGVNEMPDYTVIAPAIHQIEKYNNTQYRNDITKIMSKYLTTQVKYEINITTT